MEIQGRSNVCVQFSVRIYIAVGDGKTCKGSLLATPFHSVKVVPIAHITEKNITAL